MLLVVLFRGFDALFAFILLLDISEQFSFTIKVKRKVYRFPKNPSPQIVSPPFVMVMDKNGTFITIDKPILTH